MAIRVAGALLMSALGSMVTLVLVSVSADRGGSARCPMVVERSHLSSSLQILLRDERSDSIIRAPKGHPAGHIVYGPHWKLHPGRYEAEVALEFGEGGEMGESLCNVDVYDGERIVGQRAVLRTGDKGVQRVLVAFNVERSDLRKLYEIRLWCSGKAAIVVRKIAFLAEH